MSYYAPDGTQVAQVILDGRTGAVDEAWHDQQARDKLARGYSGAIAQKVNAPYVWIPLCVLFSRRSSTRGGRCASSTSTCSW